MPDSKDSKKKILKAYEFLALKDAAEEVVNSAQSCDRNVVYVSNEKLEKLKEFFE